MDTCTKQQGEKKDQELTISTQTTVDHRLAITVHHTPCAVDLLHQVLLVVAVVVQHTHLKPVIGNRSAGLCQHTIIIIIIIALLKCDTPVILGSMRFTNNVIHSFASFGA